MALNKTIKGKLIVKSSDGREFFVDKEILADVFPVFRTAFSNDMVESATNSYTTNFSGRVVEQFLLFSYCGLLPDNETVWVELTKMAHLYEVHQLVKLCEVHLVEKVCNMALDKKFAVEDGMLEIIETAALLGLKTLLGCWILYLAEHEPKLHRSNSGKKWGGFCKRNPAVRTSLDELISYLLDGPVPDDYEEEQPPGTPSEGEVERNSEASGDNEEVHPPGIPGDGVVEHDPDACGDDEVADESDDPMSD